MSWNSYLSGEIHTDWRQPIIDADAMAWARTPEEVVEILRYTINAS